MVGEDLDGLNGYYMSEPKVRLMSEELLIDGRYCIDSSIMIDYKGPITVADGEHSIDLWARDLAGNQATTNVSLKVDTTLPSSGILLSHLPDGENGYYITPPIVELYNDDDEAVMEVLGASIVTKRQAALIRCWSWAVCGWVQPWQLQVFSTFIC